VANHFGQYSTVAAEKFGGTPVPQPYVNVDTRPAARVRIGGEDLSAEARVVRGFFLVAAPPTEAEEPSYTITMLDEAGGVLAVATDVSPPD
jgi:hypothetical protein